MEGNKLRVAYFEGRPKSHPTHSLYANSVDAKFNYFDKYLRYHDLPGSSKLRRYFSWALTAIFFPSKDYDVLLTEEPYFAVLLLKIFSFKNPKLVSLLGTHTLYFIKEKKYSFVSTKLLLYLFSKYDAIICEGEMQKEMLRTLFTNATKKPNVFSIANGSNTKRLEVLLKNEPDLESNRIVTIAEVSNRDRLYYKGLDINFLVFNELIENKGDYYYDIIGDISEEIKSLLLNSLSNDAKKRVAFLGRINNFEDYLQHYCLSLHIARGEAWGIAINDCMAAGIPTIVSEWTGAKEIVINASSKLIAPLELEKIITITNDYFQLSLNDKISLSKKCKMVSSQFTEEKAIQSFKDYFQLAIN